jgi:hypothetical protein
MGSSIESFTYLAAATSLVSVAITLAVLIALLAVALGPVRRHRPDVSGLFVAAAGVMMLATIGSPITNAIVPFFLASDGGPRESGRMLLVVNVLFSTARAGGLAMVVAGIARLAGSGRTEPREP